MATTRFRTPGKLLLTGEYAVLDGAIGFAVPTRLGQTLEVESDFDGKYIQWNAFHQEKHWLTVQFEITTLRITSTNNQKAAEFVARLLYTVARKNPTLFDNPLCITTRLEFPAHYGLGSSSTLISNVARWAGMDPYELNEDVLGGSGYDIAVALHGTPLTYQLQQGKRMVEEVDFKPSFLKELLFVPLNTKQDSREGIDRYRKQPFSSHLIAHLSEITNYTINCANLNEFGNLMESHELALSSFLGLKTVKQERFSDIPVFVKSLGAWGGDFVMTQRFSGFEDYFNKKGFHSVFTWGDLIA